MFIIQAYKKMKMIGHQNIFSNPCAVFGTRLCEDLKTIVHLRIGEQISAFLNASRDEINWMSFKNEIETCKSRGFQRFDRRSETAATI